MARGACRKVKKGGTTWYCCQGRVTKGPHKGKPAVCCAPMVGKNKVTSAGSFCAYLGSDGKFHRLGTKKGRK